MTPLGLQIGVSLFEVLIVVAIVGVITSFALPAFNELSRNQCLISKSTDLITALHFARSEAVKRRQSVTISARDIATTPIKEWSDGWDVAVVVGTGTNTVVDVIRRFELLGCSQTTMDETVNITAGDPIHDDLAYTYFPTGFIDTTGTIDICDDRTREQGRRVSINITGRPSITRIQCIP